MEELEEKLHKLMKRFMLENGVSYVWFSASTNHKLDDIHSSITIEMEIDTMDQGFKC